MNTTEILRLLQQDIHSVVFATLDSQGLPRTCVIDLMLADEEGLYFLTARGKAFYERLAARPVVALTGLQGQHTLGTVAISLQGRVRSLGRQRLEEIFARNPYMEKLYPTPQSRDALEVFQIYAGEGECFDLRCQPPLRQTFAFGGAQARPAGYRIDPQKCIGCQGCRSVCPAGCIANTVPRQIDASHCLHCGNCYRICPVHAVEKQAAPAERTAP